MVISQFAILLALSALLFIVTSDGRRMQANVVPSKTSLLDSTFSTTTNSDDVEALMRLINQYPGLIGVQFPLLSKDPCYPQMLDWIECSNDSIHRVTALYLGNKGLYQPLPDFSSMDALQTIDLRLNLLTGAIPEFLGTFPELTYLNLANNYFTGPLPDSLADNKKLKLILGNPLCSGCSGSPPPPPPPTPTLQSQLNPPTPNVQFPFPSGPGNDDTGKTEKSKLPTILGITIPPSVLAAIGVAVFAAFRRRKRKATAGDAVAEIAVEIAAAAVT